MKISILLPYYNDQKFLSESIESVLKQTYTNFELILINHASTDESRKIAHFYNDKRIIHVDLKNNLGAGGGHIMQTFLDIATGQFFKSMCADDVMEKDCLEKLINSISKEYVAVFGDMEFIDELGNSLQENWWNFKKVNFNNSILEYFKNGHSMLPYPAALIDMMEFRKIKIDRTMHAMFDMTLWIQLLQNNKKFNLIKDKVIKYRIHKEQASSSSKEEKLKNTSFFESFLYYQYFFDNNMPLENRYLLAMEFIESSLKQRVLVGLQELVKLLNSDEKTRKFLENKFKFDSGVLRKIYATKEIFIENDIKNFKTRHLIRELKRRFKTLFIKKPIKKLKVI